MTKSPASIASRYRQEAISRILGWIAVVAIVALSLVPGDLRPQVGSSNHIEHFAAYFVAALFLARGYFEIPRFVFIAISLTVLAAVLEITQLWIPGRMGRVTDFAGGTLGIWVGIASVAIVRRAMRA